MESFLHRKLEPVKQVPDVFKCLKGTRKDILSSVNAWLTSEEANVCWISGPAGVGKTALASTIVNNVSNFKEPSYRFYNCAKFFIKERDVNLRNPRAIWRSISAQLASFNRGIRLGHLKLFSGDGEYAYPEDAGIQDQFHYLIREPLKKHFPFNSMSPRRTLVVIDALDECGIHSRSEWSTFLDTVISWSKELPWTCKLLVTSRPEADIQEKLNHIRRLELDENARGSYQDIQLFFETTFEETKVDKLVSTLR